MASPLRVLSGSWLRDVDKYGRVGAQSSNETLYWAFKAVVSPEDKKKFDAAFAREVASKRFADMDPVYKGVFLENLADISNTDQLEKALQRLQGPEKIFIDTITPPKRPKTPPKRQPKGPRNTPGVPKTPSNSQLGRNASILGASATALTSLAPGRAVSGSGTSANEFTSLARNLSAVPPALPTFNSPYRRLSQGRFLPSDLGSTLAALPEREAPRFSDLTQSTVVLPPSVNSPINPTPIAAQNIPAPNFLNLVENFKAGAGVRSFPIARMFDYVANSVGSAQLLSCFLIGQQLLNPSGTPIGFNPTGMPIALSGSSVAQYEPGNSLARTLADALNVPPDTSVAGTVALYNENWWESPQPVTSTAIAPFEEVSNKIANYMLSEVTVITFVAQLDATPRLNLPQVSTIRNVLQFLLNQDAPRKNWHDAAIQKLDPSFNQGTSLQIALNRAKEVESTLSLQALLPKADPQIQVRINSSLNSTQAIVISENDPIEMAAVWEKAVNEFIDGQTNSGVYRDLFTAFLVKLTESAPLEAGGVWQRAYFAMTGTLMDETVIRSAARQVGADLITSATTQLESIETAITNELTVNRDSWTIEEMNAQPIAQQAIALVRSQDISDVSATPAGLSPWIWSLNTANALAPDNEFARLKLQKPLFEFAKAKLSVAKGAEYYEVAKGNQYNPVQVYKRWFSSLPRLKANNTDRKSAFVQAVRSILYLTSSYNSFFGM